MTIPGVPDSRPENSKTVSGQRHARSFPAAGGAGWASSPAFPGGCEKERVRRRADGPLPFQGSRDRGGPPAKKRETGRLTEWTKGGLNFMRHKVTGGPAPQQLTEPRPLGKELPGKKTGSRRFPASRTGPRFRQSVHETIRGKTSWPDRINSGNHSGADFDLASGDVDFLFGI